METREQSNRKGGATVKTVGGPPWPLELGQRLTKRVGHVQFLRMAESSLANQTFARFELKMEENAWLLVGIQAVREGLRVRIAFRPIGRDGVYIYEGLWPEFLGRYYQQQYWSAWGRLCGVAQQKEANFEKGLFLVEARTFTGVVSAG